MARSTVKEDREAGLIRNEPFGRQRKITLRRAELDERFPGLVDAVVAPGGAQGGPVRS